MSKKIVESEIYDDEWINSAWGGTSNEALLSGNGVKPRPRVAHALSLADIKPGIKLLDIACGRGEVPLLAAQQGADAVGIDYSDKSVQFANKMVNSAKENNKSKNTSSINILRADACRLPFCDQSFDRITMLDIVEHLNDDQLELLFSEINRLLTPTGFAVIHTLPNRWVYDITIPILSKIFRKIQPDPRSKYEKLIHINEQDILSLHKHIRKSKLNHRIWLEQLIPAQARWNADIDKYNDSRDKYYPLLSGALGRSLELICKTPAKLFLSNDIFSVVWKNEPPKNISIPMALSERMTLFLFTKKQ
jgi:cyclopropane fatty-acyl-phospholipid synthase-like methyltransferase